MENKQIAVVFDTNSYRDFVSGKTVDQVINDVDELVTLEARKNIAAFGIEIVSLEMLAHLSDETKENNYSECLNGIIAMASHCYDEVHSQPRIVPRPYLHIINSFFGEVPESIKIKSQNIGGVVHDFKINHLNAIDHHNKQLTFKNIKEYIEKEEFDFANNIEDLINAAKAIVKSRYPTLSRGKFKKQLLDFIMNGEFEPFMALALIQAVAVSLGMSLAKDEIVKRAFELNNTFPLSVGFYRWICNKIVSDKVDMKSKKSRQKKWNWIWDYQVSFLISDHTLDNKDVILVTADTDLTNIIADHGYSHRVMNINEYVNFLKV